MDSSNPKESIFSRKQKKKYSPPSPQSAKTACATRASKRATVIRKARPAAEMASVSADEDVIRSSGEEGGNDRSHAEQEMGVFPA